MCRLLGAIKWCHAQLLYAACREKNMISVKQQNKKKNAIIKTD